MQLVEIPHCKVLYRLMCVLMWLAVTPLAAQNVTVINNYHGGGDSLLPENYVLRDVTRHTYVINEFEPSNTSTRSLLNQMITYGLRSFIDHNYHVFDGRIESLSSPDQFDQEATAVVRNAIWIHELPFSDEFPGFSRAVLAMVETLRQLDGYSIRYGDEASAPPADGTVGLYTFQRMVYELKTAAEEEAYDFVDRYLPQTRKREYDNLKGVILTPREYKLEGQRQVIDDLADLEPDESVLLTPKGSRRIKRNKAANDEASPFNEQIVHLLEENNRILADYSNRFADMQRQIDELRENRNDDMRRELATMRSMIENIANDRPAGPRDSPSTATTSTPVAVVFDKNQHELTYAQKAQLNRVEIEMTKHPRYRALITGYADKSGDPDFNAWISQKRAHAVRNYLVSTGVPRSRLTVSFLGDAESDSPNPQDRKVEVTYLVGTDGTD